MISICADWVSLLNSQFWLLLVVFLPVLWIYVLFRITTFLENKNNENTETKKLNWRCLFMQFCSDLFGGQIPMQARKHNDLSPQ